MVQVGVDLDSHRQPAYHWVLDPSLEAQPENPEDAQGTLASNLFSAMS
jgi:hypothetical protein